MFECDPSALEALHLAAADLDPAQLRTLASICGSDVAHPSSARLQRALQLPTARATEMARSLTEAWARGIQAGHAAVTFEILSRERALVAAHAGQVEIVCTAPLDLGMPVRATLPQALEMVDAANREIVTVGYVFSHGARELLGRMAVAQERGVRVSVVANRLREQVLQFIRLWPEQSRLPELYSRDANPHDEMAALHAKLLICDGKTALVTSANFTHHGLRGNIEVGVCVTDVAIARLRDFVFHLIATGEVQLLPTPERAR